MAREDGNAATRAGGADADHRQYIPDASGVRCAGGLRLHASRVSHVLSDILPNFGDRASRIPLLPADVCAHGAHRQWPSLWRVLPSSSLVERLPEEVSKGPRAWRRGPLCATLISHVFLTGCSIPAVRMHGVHVDRVQFPAARFAYFSLICLNKVRLVFTWKQGSNEGRIR